MDTEVTELDMEWVELFQEAISLGLTIDDIRDYFLNLKSIA